MDEDTEQAAWAEQELNEREQWERHMSISRSYRRWLTTIGVLKEQKPNDEMQSK